MTVHAVPPRFTGIDFEPCKVGRPVISARAYQIADGVHHMLQVRRKCGLTAVYQVDVPSTRGAAAGEQHRWDYLTGYHTRWIRVDVTTLGGVASTSTAAGLILTTTTDPVGVYMAPVVDAAAPGATLDEDVVQTWSAVIQVAPNAVETVDVDQVSVTDLVRILGISITEMPLYQIDTATDAAAVALNQFASGEEIIATEYDDLCLGVQNTRRFHKKILFQSCKQLATNNELVGNIEDLHTKSIANLLQFDYFTSVSLPELVDPSVNVAAYVYAQTTGGGTGTVRFACTGGNIDIAGIGALGNYAATGTVNRGQGTVSLQGYVSAPGTLTVYSAVLLEVSTAI